MLIFFYWRYESVWLWFVTRENCGYWLFYKYFNYFVVRYHPLSIKCGRIKKFWSASLWDWTHLKEKSVVWVDPMLCVLGDPKFFGKTPLLLKKNKIIAILFHNLVEQNYSAKKEKLGLKHFGILFISATICTKNSFSSSFLLISM